MNVRVTARDIAAKEECLRQYALSQDFHSTQEQIMAVDGRVVEAVGEHQYALWCLKGYRAELDDRPSPRPNLSACGACLKDRCDGCRMCRVLGRPT